MKIAMLSPIHWRTPPRRYGSWELVVSNLTEELVRRRHDVTLFATGDSITRARLVSVCPKPIMEKHYEDTRTYEYLHSVLPFERADEFDIIHNHYNAYPLVFSKFIKTPVVTTIHGFSSREILKIYRKYSNTYYISISNADRKNAPDLNYAATVYHGVDTEKYTLGKGGDYLVYVGRISWQKGIHVSCEVAKRCGVPLLLGGFLPSEEKNYFNKQVKPYLSKRIQYVGEVSEKQKIKLLQNALAFVQFNDPKYFGEGFGLPLVEAQACGTPVVARKHCPIPEVVSQKRTGFVVRTLDEAVRALKNIHTLNRKDCRAFVLENFTLEKMAEGYIQAYEKILSNVNA